MPEKNKRDLAEIPSNVKRKISFVPAQNMDKVLALAVNGKVRGHG